MRRSNSAEEPRQPVGAAGRRSSFGRSQRGTRIASTATVAISGHETSRVAVCNQVRSFDLEARVRAGSARYVESLDQATTNEIVSRVLSVIDPAGA